MKQIEPITIWVNGTQQVANYFTLNSSQDNLFDSAVFSYFLYNSNNEGFGNDTLSSGSLNMSGETYQEWDSSTSANEWAYDWAAGQLNLVLIPE